MILNYCVTKIKMETILLLAHVETGGSLARTAREALRAARALNKAIAGSNLFVGLIGESVQAAADSIAARHKVFRRGGRGVWPVALLH